MQDGRPGRTMRMGAYSMRGAQLGERRSRQGDLTAAVRGATFERVRARRENPTVVRSIVKPAPEVENLNQSESVVFSITPLTVAWPGKWPLPENVSRRADCRSFP